MKTKLEKILFDVANCTCCLQGHCSYADSIIEARKCFGTKMDGTITIENPSLQSLMNTSESIVKAIKYKSVCPLVNKCETKKKVLNLKKHYQSI